MSRWALVTAALLGAAIALALSRSAGWWTVVELLAAAATGACVAFVALRSRARAMHELRDAARRLAAGDLGARAPARGGHAMAEVGAALNDLAVKHAEELRELAGNRDLATAILDGMGEGVLLLDQRGRIVLANPAARTMTLLGAGAVGKTLLETLRNAALQELVQTAQRSDEQVEREVALGGLFPRRLLARACRLRGPAADRGVILVFHDVTDLRRLETMRTDFVANVSHELRTPVTAISTAVETLLSGALADQTEAPEFIGIIDRQARRLRQLVDDLLDLSRMEAKGFKLKLAEADVVPLVEQAARPLEEPARQRNVTLQVRAPPHVVGARVDRRALEQTVMNLLDNAIKYAGDGATVGVSVKSTDREVTIEVTDDGPGIPAAHLSRIFERFYRVDAGRSRELGGTGLGLSIVKHLVELMHGEIEVGSQVGQGTTFRIRLPAP